MRIHPREQLVRDAADAVREAVNKALHGRELTTLEILRVLHETLADKAGTLLKYEIREERHGNTDKPGGLA